MKGDRECSRCKGTEIHLASDCGVVIQWRDKSGKTSEWFCPNCDWGETPEGV